MWKRFFNMTLTPGSTIQTQKTKPPRAAHTHKALFAHCLRNASQNVSTFPRAGIPPYLTLHSRYRHINVELLIAHVMDAGA